MEPGRDLSIVTVLTCTESASPLGFPCRLSSGRSCLAAHLDFSPPGPSGATSRLLVKSVARKSSPPPPPNLLPSPSTAKGFSPSNWNREACRKCLLHTQQEEGRNCCCRWKILCRNFSTLQCQCSTTHRRRSHSNDEDRGWKRSSRYHAKSKY